MAKRPNLGQISSPVFTVSQLNEAYAKIDNAFDNTLSRDGSTPNTMQADLDMNSNDILNAGVLYGATVNVDEAYIGGKLFTGTLTWRSDWLTATSYQENDLVKINGNVYVCLDEHTSGVFASDLSALRWELFVENVTGPAGPTGDTGADGPAGQGVPVGGTTGQVLAKIDGTNYNTEWVDQSGGGGGVTDGDKGDITVSASGATWTIDNNAVTLAKMADMATSSLIYRKTAGSGDPEVNTLATLKTDLGLTGTNSGDQTSIVGITGTKAQFDTAVTDGNFMYVGDAPTVHTHTLANITDVTMTVANLNSLDDGANTTLHFHNTDRDRANHTGTQLAATISDFATAVAATAAVTANTAKVTNANHTGDVTGATSLTIANDVVSNAKLANVATSTIKGRVTAGTGDPEDLTGTQATTLLDTFTTSLKGLAPASGGGTTNFLRADGTWAAPSGGGGGTPGGSTTQIQYNDAGAFAGDADFTWDSAANTLALGGTDTGIILAGITNEPAAPSAGQLRLYSKSIAGRMIPKVKGPSGIDYPLQASFWQNNIMMWSMTTATAGLWYGTSGSGSGTFSNTPPTTTNQYTAMKRYRYSNVVTTLNQTLGHRNSELTFFRGNAAGHGGWFFFTRCGFDTWTNGGRFFAGMHTSPTVITADPSALNNTAGFAVDAADNGLIHFLTRGTSATKTSTGLTITSQKGYDLYMFCAPNSSEISWRIVDFVAGTEASGTQTTNLPAATTMMGIGTLASNAALTPVNSIQLGLSRIYAETDY